MRYFWFVIFMLSVGSVSAQNSARVRELEKQRKAALAEIEMTSQLLDETRQTARNSLNRLNLLSKQILSRKQVISLLNQEIGEIDKQIAASRRNISQLERELENKRQNYGKSVQSMYKRRSSQDKLLFILSADNFAQSFRRMRYLREYADWQKKQASEIIGKQKEIAGKQKELEKGLLQNAGATDEIDKSRTGTVHDRNFRRIHFNDEVINTQAVERAHQMLNRGDDDLAFVQSRRQTRIVDGFGSTWQIHRRRDVDAAKHNTRIGRSRSHQEFDLATGM